MEDKTIQKMLTALLQANNQIHWVGSYAHGLTKEGDPYIVLFPAAEYLEHQVCRVYPEHFRKLPEFIPRETPADIRPSKSSPKKDAAVPCPVFSVLTYPGKETQMGPETRFSDTLFITKQNPTGQNVQYAALSQPKPAPPPQPTPPRPDNGTARSAPQPKPAPVATAKTTAPAPPSKTHFCPHCETYPVDQPGEFCENCQMETERETGNGTPLQNPHPPRPWTPAYLRRYLTVRADELASANQPSQDQRKLIGPVIEAAANVKDPAKARRLVLSYLFQTEEPGNLATGQAIAALRWLAPQADTGGSFSAAGISADEIAAILELFKVK